MNAFDALVPSFEAEPGDWEDVLRRARRRPSRRGLVLAIAAAVAALAAASAVALPYFLPDGVPRLPLQEEWTHAGSVVDPGTGRVLLKVVRWPGQEGVCFRVYGTLRCVSVSRGGIQLAVGPERSEPTSFWTYTFDPRVASARVSFADGTSQTLPRHRFGARLYRLRFFGPVSLRKPYDHITFYDAAGRPIRSPR